MAKVRMKNASSIRIFPSWPTEFKRVFTNIFILGIAERLLSGLKSLKVLIADTLPTKLYSSAVTTTKKSSQFHPSRR